MLQHNNDATKAEHYELQPMKEGSMEYRAP